MCIRDSRITDPALRERLVPLTGGQQHVAQAAEFWVFCADFNRHLQICPQAELGLAEQLLIGVVDTALLAQNALTAAESLGLGGVYIGGLRNSIEAVTELLEMCIRDRVPSVQRSNRLSLCSSGLATKCRRCGAGLLIC